MYSLLIRLILLVTLAELGMQLADIENCQSRQCLKQIERASREVRRIDWKPISIFFEKKENEIINFS